MVLTLLVKIVSQSSWSSFCVARRLPATPGPQPAICSTQLNGNAAESLSLPNGERLLSPFSARSSRPSPTPPSLQFEHWLGSAEFIQFAHPAGAAQAFFVFCFLLVYWAERVHRGTGRMSSRRHGSGGERGTTDAFQQHWAIPAVHAVKQKFIPSPFTLTALVLCCVVHSTPNSLGAKYKKLEGLSLQPAIPRANGRVRTLGAAVPETPTCMYPRTRNPLWLRNWFHSNQWQNSFFKLAKWKGV